MTNLIRLSQKMLELASWRSEEGIEEGLPSNHGCLENINKVSLSYTSAVLTCSP